MGLFIPMGGIGSGKTLMTLAAMEAGAKLGRPIYTNIKLTERCPFYKRACFIDDVKWPIASAKPNGEGLQYYWEYVLPGSIVVIDEADLWFDSRKNQQFEDDLVHFHKQLRKQDLDIYYITQRLPSLYCRVRDMAQEYIICQWNYRTDRVIRWLGKEMSRFWRHSYNAPKAQKSFHVNSGYYSYAEAQRFFGWYGTRQIFSAGGSGRWIDKMRERARAEAGKVKVAALASAAVVGDSVVGGPLLQCV